MRRARGFTLIELLVVLVVLGCLLGLVVLGSGIAGPGRELRGEAERLAGLIGVLAEEAVLDNREYGLRLSGAGYQVLRFEQRSGVWQALPDQAHRLPDWAEWHLEVDGQPLRLPAQDGEQGAAPQLLLLSSGELSPFRLTLRQRRQDGPHLQLSSDGFRLPRVEPAGGRGG